MIYHGLVAFCFTFWLYLEFYSGCNSLLLRTLCLIIQHDMTCRTWCLKSAFSFFVINSFKKFLWDLTCPVFFLSRFEDFEFLVTIGVPGLCAFCPCNNFVFEGQSIAIPNNASHWNSDYSKQCKERPFLL